MIGTPITNFHVHVVWNRMSQLFDRRFVQETRLVPRLAYWDGSRWDHGLMLITRRKNEAATLQQVQSQLWPLGQASVTQCCPVITDTRKTGPTVSQHSSISYATSLVNSLLFVKQTSLLSNCAVTCKHSMLSASVESLGEILTAHINWPHVYFSCILS